MNAIKDPLLFSLINEFLTVHLTKLSNKSLNTVYAYRESLNALPDFVKADKHIALADITFKMIDHKMVERFLDYIELDRGCETSTRNHRLNRIRAFYKYAAKNQCPAVPDNAHPHLWRHSRAMHLYQRGVDLTLISQWLGHAKMETTRIYAKADTEQKRKAIEKADANTGPLSQKLNADRFTISDDDTLKRLYGMKV